MTTKAERKAAKRAAREANKAPRPSELLGKSSPEEEKVDEPVAEATEQSETEAKVEAEAEPKAEASTLEQMITNLPPELREKAKAELEKLQTQARKNEAAKAWVGFDSALRDEAKGLPKFIGDLAKEHGVDLTNRRITITYPDGKFSYTNSPKWSKSGNNGRSGFPQTWGDAEVIGKDGKKTKYASPSKAAEALGLQVEGMRDMVDVFENPHERGTKAELPKNMKVDAVRGEHFRVTITK